VQKWVEDGAVNVYPLLLVLRAQEKTFDRKSTTKEIRDAFENAIKVAGRSGFVQYKGMAAELAGHYFHRSGDENDSDFYACR